MSPKQQSLQNLQENYEGAIGILGKYQTKMLGIIDVQVAQKLVKEFEEKALGALVNVSESAVKVADRKQSGKQDESPLSSKEKEDFAHGYGNRVAKRIDPEHGGFLTMEEFLDEIIRMEAEILSRGSIRIPVRIFSPKGSASVVTGNGGGMEETKTAPKYESLVRILAKRSIDISGLMVGVETLEKSQMRSIPYRVVWMANPLRTICISDEVGEKTYVYHGFVDIASLAAHEKGEPIRGVPAVGVTCSDTYEMSLEQAIFNEIVSFTEDIEIITDVLSSLNPEFVPNAEILIYQSTLNAHESVLAEAGIIQENGIWYFGDTKGRRFWPDINGKSLGSFPNRGFNKAQDIGDKNGKIQNPEALKEMFRVLGLAVTTEEQEKIRWGMMLQNAEEAIAEAGIIQENGIWYFGDAKGYKFWPMINGKNLVSFPNCVFNKARDIGSNNGQILNVEALKEMFMVLGLIVASNEQELKRQEERNVKILIPQLRKELENAEEVLAEVGIIQENGIWYFGDAKGCKFWPDINGRNLRSFPSGGFNKARGIGDKRSMIQNPEALKEIFRVLGFTVATEEQELQRQQDKDTEIMIPEWRKKLENAEEVLLDVGIIQENGVWHFSDTKGYKLWPDINGRNLKSFPNQTFNKARGIGNKDGQILNAEALREMFRILGLAVTTEEQELERKKRL